MGSPCCVFPLFSPSFLGGRGGVFCSLAISCILHLFWTIESVNMVYRPAAPATPPAPPPPGPFPWGVCDPAQLLGTMVMAVCFCYPAGHCPQESTLAVSPVLESILGVCLFLFATLQRRFRLGSLRMGILFSLPVGSCIFRVLFGQCLSYKQSSPTWPFLCSGFYVETAQNAGLLFRSCFSLLPSWL